MQWRLKFELKTHITLASRCVQLEVSFLETFPQQASRKGRLFNALHKVQCLRLIGVVFFTSAALCRGQQRSLELAFAAEVGALAPETSSSSSL